MNQAEFTTQKQAERFIAQEINRIGGKFVWQAVAPRQYVVEQIQTKAQVEHEKQVVRARESLKPEYDWWSNERWSGFGYLKSTAEHTVAKFAERLAQNPHDAFHWGSDAVEAAAVLQVLKTIQHYHERGVSDAVIADQLQEDLLRDRSVGCSTSPMANIANHALRCAQAKVLKSLRSHIEHRYNAVLTVSSDETYGNAQ